MIYNNEQLEQVSKLLAWKKSKQFMADKLGIPVAEVNELLSELRSIEKPVIIREDQSGIDSILGRRGLDGAYDIAGGWVKESGVSIRFNKKTEVMDDTNFIKFLETYIPKADPITCKDSPHAMKVNSCLVINKQDSHLNKYDVGGDNNIQKRFRNFYDSVAGILTKAKSTSNLQRVIYVIGSDEFNSEFTGRTVHDTPQQNIMDYHTGFEAICSHEISIINLLLERAHNVHVLYIPGNHDEHVGWHMASWLKTYYRECGQIHFDIAPTYTKYIKYSNTGMCFNHGYIVKPEQLAQNFPLEFKEHWSACDNFYIFAGDKHTELARAIGGIKFYRLAQVSKAKSKFDSERGYIASKGELTAFLIEETEGLTDVYHKTIG